LDDILYDFDSRLDCLHDSNSDLYRIMTIEKVLLGLINLNLLPKEEHNKLINAAYCTGNRINFKDYCYQIGINQRTFERSFKKNIGVSPKSFIKLTRFQIALNQLISGKYSNLTSLSHNLDYFDQTHFIKDFKSYMRTTPLDFVKQKKSIKNIFK
jgi:AraC-like DNA-binding protein